MVPLHGYLRARAARRDGGESNLWLSPEFVDVLHAETLFRQLQRFRPPTPPYSTRADAQQRASRPSPSSLGHSILGVADSQLHDHSPASNVFGRRRLHGLGAHEDKPERERGPVRSCWHRRRAGAVHPHRDRGGRPQFPQGHGGRPVADVRPVDGHSSHGLRTRGYPSELLAQGWPYLPPPLVRRDAPVTYLRRASVVPPLSHHRRKPLQ